jgi:alpha-ketoglutarate-dependent taurine dioxygenase
MESVIAKSMNPSEFPLVIEPVDRSITLQSFLTLLRSKNGYFKEQLLKHGGLLFRHFPIQNEYDFASVIHSLQMGHFIDYIGGDSPRKKLVGGVYTSTEAPPSVKIPLHNELSFVKRYPTHIYFYCATPPSSGGETIIGDARKIYHAIEKDVRERFIEKGVRYISCYPHGETFLQWVNKSHKTWMDVFETEEREEVEQKCLENDFGFVWHQNDWLQISQERPAIIEHPETRERVWFNQAHLFQFTPKFLSWWRYVGVRLLYCRKHTRLHEVFFADHTPIPRQDLYHILDVLDDHTVYFTWSKGDLLVLDNVLAMHGRATFRGKRRILTAMTGYTERDSKIGFGLRESSQGSTIASRPILEI